MTAQENESLVRRALSALPEKEREAVGLCYEMNLSHAEAAVVMGIPRRTLTEYLNRGLERMRRSLTAQGLAVATPALLAAALSARPLPALSPLFVDSLRKMATDPTFSAMSAAASAASVKSKAAIGWALAAVLVVGVAAGGGYLWQSDSAPAQSLPPTEKTTATSVAAQPFSVSWNFNDKRTPEEIVPLQGDWKIASAAGPDGSACLVVEPLGGNEPLPGEMFYRPDGTLGFVNNLYAVARLNLSQVKPPLLVSFRAALIGMKHPDHMGVMLSWEHVSAVSFSNGRSARQLGPLFENDPKKIVWRDYKIYVTDKAVYLLVDGKPTNISLEEPAENASLLIWTRGSWLVDDLVVRSAAGDEMPDVKEAVAKVETKYGAYVRHQLPLSVKKQKPLSETKNVAP